MRGRGQILCYVVELSRKVWGKARNQPCSRRGGTKRNLVRISHPQYIKYHQHRPSETLKPFFFIIGFAMILKSSWMSHLFLAISWLV